MMVDEADIDILGSTSSSSKGLKRSLASSEVGNLASSISNRPLSKRKPGPIPREFRRPSISSPPSTPPSSPIPWAVDDGIKRPSSPPLPPPPLEPTNAASPVAIAVAAASSTSLVTNVIVRSLNNYNCNASPAYENSEQKLVNGDLLTAGVFEPVLPTNSLKSAGNGAATENNAPAYANNVDALTISKSSNYGGVNSFGKSAELNSDYSGLKDSCSVVKVKCEVESTSGYSNSSSAGGVGNSAVNHVDERRDDPAKVEKERPLTPKEQEEVKRHNSSVRNLIFKEVRRKGHSEYFLKIFIYILMKFFIVGNRFDMHYRFRDTQ